MHSGQIRLSRISYPRSTWWVMLALTVTFLLFGLWAQISLADNTPQVLSQPLLTQSANSASELAEGRCYGS
ncbi:MAG: hypothetical protein AAF513_05710 [Pseudomonadota bacterium]